MVIYAAQGDPGRSMALLWRTGTPDAGARPGPKPALTVDGIVAAAIAVADEHGMAGLSMRAVGERLGRTAMALYTHVADKAELVDLMYDQAHAELAGLTAPDDWRGALTAWAEHLLAFYLRHPWVLHVSAARPVLGPHELTAMEAVLRVIRGTGVRGGVARGVVSAVFGVAQGSARVLAETRAAAGVTGQSDDDWWYARAPHLEAAAPDFGERFPSLVWLEQDKTPPEDPCEPYLEAEARAAFRAGVALLLDGLAAQR